MKGIEKIIHFFKNRLNKKDKKKRLNPPQPQIVKENQEEFMDSLKIEKKEEAKKRKIETLTCPGDGLGIQHKINY